MKAVRHLAEEGKADRATVLPAGYGEALALLGLLDRPVWIYDFVRPGIAWANPAGLALWQAQDLAELQARDFSPTAAGTAARLSNLHEALLRGETRQESWTIYPAGQPLRCDCRLSGVRLADGSIAVLVDAAPAVPATPDQTFELRALEAVRQSALMVSMVSESGQWLMHNPAAEALINRLGMHNLPGLDNLVALFAHRDEASALRRAAIAGGTASGTLRMAGKAFCMHEVTLRRLNDPVTGRLSLMVSQQDVTRAYRLERRLHKAVARERAIAETQRQFLSVTSHDFRTPLAVIDGAARRIERLAEHADGMGAASLAQSAQTIAARAVTIRQTARRMAQAVDRTLGWASIEEGKVDFRPERSDLRVLVEQALLAQRALHPDRPLVTRLEPVAELSLDRALVHSVLENLLSNAIKYSAPDAPVEVCCFEQGNDAVVSIADRGIGIPAEEMSRLFSRFFRSTNARGYTGSGVGLHAARFYMELHGGRIEVRTRAGEGSTFTIMFPVAP